MSLFKFHLIKLEKLIVFQPLFLSESLHGLQRSIFIDRDNKYSLVKKSYDDKQFVIVFGGNSELGSSMLYFGDKYNIHISRECVRKFTSNVDRDKYYDILINSIGLLAKSLR